eukprot:TRINITY_DN2_c0_g2_i1.p1 TRINITY_DN2_c0_g2~~TRINITY_DN2_c0_g2_i1.p1  ORF type:complete len:133 (+),score=4.39 TRINITY_DN2_c0_g2_i1:45-443(+)
MAVSTFVNHGGVVAIMNMMLPNCSTQCNNGILARQSGFHYSLRVQRALSYAPCNPTSYEGNGIVGNVYNMTVCCIAGGSVREVEAFISAADVNQDNSDGYVGLGQNCALAFGGKQHFLGLVLRNGVSSGNCY